MDLHRMIGRELALTVAVALVQIGGVALAAPHQDDVGTLTWWSVGLLATAVAAVPLRLVAPAPAAWLALAATWTYWTLDTPRGPVYFALIITFANLLLTHRRRQAIAMAVTGFVAFSWLQPLARGEGQPSLLAVTALGAWLITLFSVIEAVRARRERQRTAEHSRNETLRRQIAAERLRIAHDLHDTVAHHMSLINLQAGVALHLADDAQPQIRESLATIKASSKQALGELRSILGVLRDVDVDDPGTGSAHTDLPPDEGAGVRAAPRLPTPSLADLDELIEATRRAGVEVASHIALEGADIPTPVQVAAYRIVQESLTNVARHARPASADVTIGFDGNELTIDIANPTSSPSHLLGRGTTGNGLIGMRERAESIGGQLTAGPRLAGDFTVHARLPIGPAS